jgi:two-component sensor histidine kinase
MQLSISQIRARTDRWPGLTGLGIIALLIFAAPREIGAQGLRGSETNGPVGIQSVVVDSSPLHVQPGVKLRLPPQPRTVLFQFGPATNTALAPTRFRFRLDGYEEGWREYDGSMRLCIRFLDDTGDQVGETVFKVVGQTEGWTGNLETSPFTPRRESIVVPPRARSYWVVMSSAGPPATVGVYAIANLVIKAQRSEGAPAIVSLPWAFEATNNVAAGGAPAGWMRDGLRPSMAIVFDSSSAPGKTGFAIVDDDLNGHAEWHTIKEMATPVVPGERLVAEWSEAYSFGLAEQVQMTYVNLPAGYYRFRVNKLSIFGIPSETEASLAFEVPLVFWRTPWFWVSIVTTVLAAGAGTWRIIVWRRMQNELGARVTQISLLSAVAQGKQFLPDEARTEFAKVSRMTRDLVSALYETVWAVNPENDNLDALASFLCQMGNQLCSQAQLRCRLEVPDTLPNIPLSSQVRHNCSMAVKEAVHNVIKHARATEVRIRITFESSVLSVYIQDNGCGFDPAACPPGNGLSNLERRMNDIGGTCTINSRPGTGAVVGLRLRVPAAA